MDSNHKMELLNIAIQRSVEEKTIKQASGDTLMVMDDNVDDQLQLSGLLSQVIFIFVLFFFFFTLLKFSCEIIGYIFGITMTPTARPNNL